MPAFYASIVHLDCRLRGKNISQVGLLQCRQQQTTFYLLFATKQHLKRSFSVIVYLRKLNGCHKCQAHMVVLKLRFGQLATNASAEK